MIFAKSGHTICKSIEYITALCKVACLLNPLFVFFIFTLTPFSNIRLVLNELQCNFVWRKTNTISPRKLTTVSICSSMGFCTTIYGTTIVKRIFFDCGCTSPRCSIGREARANANKFVAHLVQFSNYKKITFYYISICTFFFHDFLKRIFKFRFI